MYIQDGERLSSIEATAATLYDQQGGHWTDKAAKESWVGGWEMTILYPWVRKSISILYT